MGNPRKGKDPWGFWTSKTQSKELSDAIADDDIGKCFTVLKEVIKKGDMKKR